MRTQSKGAAALAIIQLCFAFSLLLWQASQPFMGDYFALRSQMLLHEYVMGTSATFKNTEDQAARQTARFAALPLEQREKLSGDYQVLQQRVSRPFLDKFREGLYALLYETPAFEMAWIIISITLAILILLNRAGAANATWLLPILVVAYSSDSLLNGSNPKLAPDAALFPTEHVLIEEYLQAPLSRHVSEQHSQLLVGWNRYLQKNWAGENTPYPDDQALFNFTIARLEGWHAYAEKYTGIEPHQKSGWLALGAYFLWNLFFAWKVNSRHGY